MIYLTRATTLLSAMLLAACAAGPTEPTAAQPEAVAPVAQEMAVADDAAVVAEDAVEEDAPRYSRRSGCPEGYAPTGTRIKRCRRSDAINTQTMSPEALNDVGRNQSGGGTGGDPPTR